MTRKARVYVAMEAGGTGSLQDRHPPLNPLAVTQEADVALKDLTNVPAAEVAKATMSAERKASLRYNTASFRVGAELPCTRAELLSGEAHLELEKILSDLMVQGFDQGIYQALLGSVQDD